MKYAIGDKVHWVARNMSGVIFSVNPVADYYIVTFDGLHFSCWEDELMPLEWKP